MDGFELIDDGWDRTFSESISTMDGELAVMCPFVQRRVIERWLSTRRIRATRIITRFNLTEFCEGVSSTAALRLLLGAGARIRGVKHLHSKVYIFGDRRAIVTSANLTEAALQTNHESGIMINDRGGVAACRQSFDELWSNAGLDLTLDRLDGWEDEIRSVQRAGLVRIPPLALRDDGASTWQSRSASGAKEPATPLLVADAPQAFVKFWGVSTGRLVLTVPIIEEVERAGCHKACTYPKGKRPRQVRDGAVMYMGRLTRDPNDIRIFGRAIGLAHVPGKDDATASDISRRAWKKDWPHYVRVHGGEFINGELGNGVSLEQMMNELGADSFATSQARAHSGNGDSNPRAAYRQQPAVRLAAQGAEWIERRLQEAFERSGMISAATLTSLD